MSSLVFLGAGASRPFGVLTMQEMVTKFEENLKNDDQDCFELYSRIKNTLTEKYGPCHIDIESIFSVLEGIVSKITAKDLGYYAYYHIQEFCKLKDVQYPEGEPIPEYLSKAIKTRDFLKEYVRIECQVRSNISHNEIYKKSYVPLFTNILGKSKNYPGHKLKVDWKGYTTNYDNVFEGFWNEFDSYHDHFAKDGNSNTWFLSRKQLDKPSFCKLHGSLDWTQEKESGRVTRRKTSGYSLYDTEGEIMLFPVQQKDIYLYPWFTLFSDLRKGLQEQSYWYVIGYAFNDEFIRKTFEEILSYDSNKKMVIVNPNAKDIRFKFSESLRNQIDVLPIKFGDDFFKLQFEDYCNNEKTIIVRLDTPSNTVAVSCNNKIKSAKLTEDCKIQIPNLNSEMCGDIVQEHETNYARFIFDNPDNFEVKIELKIKYDYDDQLELKVSADSASSGSLNFGIDYGGRMIASSRDINAEYIDSQGMQWSKYPIILDKSKLYIISK